jgi:hypothetical protein
MLVWGFMVTGSPYAQTVTAPTGDLAKIDIVVDLLSLF